MSDLIHGDQAMTTTTYGLSLVPPDEIVARIDQLIPCDKTTKAPLVWRARNVDAQLLIAARNEILRLRAEVARLSATDMAIAMVEMSLRNDNERLRARVEVLECAIAYCRFGCEDGFCARPHCLRAIKEELEDRT